VNAPFFLVHGNDAAPRFVGRREMNVAHLGEGVANGVINGAFTDFASFDMGDGDSQGQRDGSRGEHFVAIGDQEKNVRAHLTETVRQTEGGDADGLGHADVGVGTQETLKLCGNRNAIFFDFADRVAEFGRKMRAEDDELQVHLRMRGEIVERPLKMAVVGAGSGDDGDFAFQGVLR